MAKRSVRRTRAQQAQSAPPVIEPSPTHGRPPSKWGFWTGALASAAVLVPLAVIAALLLSRGDDPSPAADRAVAAASPSAEDPKQETEALRRQFAERDKEQIKDLTDRVRTMAEDFGPVAAGMGKALPPGRKTFGPLASPADVEEWRRVVREADAYFAETVSGETATNVARNGMGNAVGILRESIETYTLALALKEPAARDAIRRRAAALRDLAARTWSTAAIQLDVINIDAGYGHQHVVFPSAKNTGAIAPDPLPEGTDAREP